MLGKQMSVLRKMSYKKKGGGGATNETDNYI